MKNFDFDQQPSANQIITESDLQRVICEIDKISLDFFDTDRNVRLNA